jgi:hypothetical protein
MLGQNFTGHGVVFDRAFYDRNAALEYLDKINKYDIDNSYWMEEVDLY